MSPERVRQLIVQGESLDIEFKSESQRALCDKEIVEAVVCLANRASAQSGWLLIGVEDNGQPTGARPAKAAPSTHSACKRLSPTEPALPFLCRCMSCPCNLRAWKSSL